MKKILILIIFLLPGIQFVFGIEFEITHLEKMNNEISYSIIIKNEDSTPVYFTHLSEPFYEINKSRIYIKYYVPKKPRLVMMDFPLFINDKKVYDQFIINETVVIKKVNNSIFAHYKLLDEDSLKTVCYSIKEVYFVFGYLEEYDDLKILISKYDSPRQRDKFYYITENQKHFQIEYKL